MSRPRRPRILPKVPATAKIPKDWSPVAAQTIEDEFTRVFRVLADAMRNSEAGLTNGLAEMTPATGDLIVGGTPAGAFELLPIDATIQRVLVNDGGLPGWGQVLLTAGVTGILPATNGGTGHAVYAVGDLLYASTTTALSRLADVATGNALISGGVSTAPAWGKIGLTTHVSGTLPLANGGTGSALVDPGADRILFWDDSDGIVDWLIVGTGLAITNKTITATGTGDVVGPGSATDEAIVRFDGTTGKLIQNSGATITDAGIATFVNTLYFGADPSASIIGRGEWTAAPSTSLNTGEWEMALYDNAGNTGVRTVPAVRVRYNDNGTTKYTELPFANDISLMSRAYVGHNAGLSNAAVFEMSPCGGWRDSGATSGTGPTLAEVASGRYALYTTAAASGSSGGFRTGNNAITRADQEPTFECVIITGATNTSVRYWIGLTSAAFTDTDTQSPSKHLAAFRYSTAAADSGWKPVTGNGTTQTVGSDVASFVDSSRLYMRIRIVGSSCFFSINSGTEVEVSGTQPGATTSLGYDLRVITQTGSSRTINISRIALSFGA